MSSVAQTKAQRESYIADAESEGHGIVLGGPAYLQLDCDTVDSYVKSVHQLQYFKKHLPIKDVWQSDSKSGNKHIHIFLTEPMERRDRVFWQAALGSDLVREALYWIRLNDGEDDEAFFVECTGHKVIELDISGDVLV